MSFTEDCELCKRRIADLIVMLEGEENPARSETKYICYECLNRPDIQAGLIESWTFAEWDDGTDD